MASFNTYNPKQYKRMADKHRVLWRWIREFVSKNEIKSILDIGCGLRSPAKKMTRNYLGVDPHPKTDALHVDFLEFPVKWLPQKELLLACHVIEHCPGFEAFVYKAKKYNARFSIISFFHGIDRDGVEYFTRKRKRLSIGYARRDIESFCKSLPVAHRIVETGDSSAVLILEGDHAVSDNPIVQ